MQDTMSQLCRQAQTSSQTSLLSVLLRGPPGCGKTAFAAKVAALSGFDMVKVISADQLIKYHSESSKCTYLQKVRWHVCWRCRWREAVLAGPASLVLACGSLATGMLQQQFSRVVFTNDVSGLVIG